MSYVYMLAVQLFQCQNEVGLSYVQSRVSTLQCLVVSCCVLVSLSAWLRLAARSCVFKTIDASSAFSSLAGHHKLQVSNCWFW